DCIDGSAYDFPVARAHGHELPRYSVVCENHFFFLIAATSTNATMPAPTYFAVGETESKNPRPLIGSGFCIVFQVGSNGVSCFASLSSGRGLGESACPMYAICADLTFATAPEGTARIGRPVVTSRASEKLKGRSRAW